MPALQRNVYPGPNPVRLVEKLVMLDLQIEWPEIEPMIVRIGGGVSDGPKVEIEFEPQFKLEPTHRQPDKRPPAEPALENRIALCARAKGSDRHI